MRRYSISLVALLVVGIISAGCAGDDPTATESPAVQTRISDNPDDKLAHMAAQEFADVAAVGAKELASLPGNTNPDEATHWVMCTLRQNPLNDFVNERALFGSWSEDQPVALVTRLFMGHIDSSDPISQQRRHQAQIGSTRWNASIWPASDGWFVPEIIDTTRPNPPWFGPTLDLRAFTDLSALLIELRLDVAPSIQTDKTGQTFERYERSSFKNEDDVVLLRGPSLFYMLLDYSPEPFSVDVWHRDGQVERIRAHLSEPRRYAELQFGVDPTPPGTNIADLGCALTFEPTDSDGMWFGPDF